MNLSLYVYFCNETYLREFGFQSIRQRCPLAWGSLDSCRSFGVSARERFFVARTLCFRGVTTYPWSPLQVFGLPCKNWRTRVLQSTCLLLPHASHPGPHSPHALMPPVCTKVRQLKAWKYDKSSSILLIWGKDDESLKASSLKTTSNFESLNVWRSDSVQLDKALKLEKNFGGILEMCLTLEHW